MRCGESSGTKQYTPNRHRQILHFYRFPAILKKVYEPLHRKDFLCVLCASAVNFYSRNLIQFIFQRCFQFLRLFVEAAEELHLRQGIRHGIPVEVIRIQL